jgi:histidinol-phosphate/aromatic aminotransferase/cobyric acid decarboxylase-like protein
MIRRPPAPARHGGPQQADEAALEDFSASTNPLGPPQELLDIVRRAPLDRYPPLDDAAIRRDLAAGFATTAARVVLGSGTAELIYRIAAAFLHTGDRVLIGGPAFPEYARAARLHGASVRTVVIDPAGRRPDPAPLLAAIRRTSPQLVWVAQPGNPSGRAWTAADLQTLAKAAQTVGALLVIDAAYRPLSTAYAVALPRSAVVLHSVTKAWGMPGLRVGWLDAPASLANRLRRAAPPWPIGRPEHAALGWLAGAAGRAFVADTRPRVLALAADLATCLRQAGADPEPSDAGFFVTAAPAAGAAAARSAGFALRALDDGRVRLAARSPAAHRRLARWWSAK